MAIDIKKPKSTNSTTEEPHGKGVIRGKRQIITTGYSPETIQRIDAAATRLGISRAAWLNMIAHKALENEG